MLRTSKQTSKHGRLRLVGMKQGKAEAYEIRETKKQKQKGDESGILGSSTHTHT